MKQSLVIVVIIPTKDGQVKALQNITRKMLQNQTWLTSHSTFFFCDGDEPVEVLPNDVCPLVVNGVMTT